MLVVVCAALVGNGVGGVVVGNIDVSIGVGGVGVGRCVGLELL